MILSNALIAKGIANKWFSIDGLANSSDTTAAPFNTSAIDLRLGDELLVAPDNINVPTPIAIDLSGGAGIASVLSKHFELRKIRSDQPYVLQPHKFILARTFETVSFPLCETDGCTTYAARVEGKSSFARCGLLVHFTAPTIHAGFAGTITLEIINLGPFPIILKPMMYICQLIIEEVSGNPTDAPN